MGPRPGDRRRRQGAHATCADDEHREVAEPTELGLRPRQPGLHERTAHEVDPGLGVHALGDAQRLLEDGVERGADVTVVLGARERASHLPEDLRLPHRHGVKTEATAKTWAMPRSS